MDEQLPYDSFADPDGIRDLSGGATARPSVRLSDADLADLFFNIPATVWTTDERLVLTFVHGAYLNRLQINPNRLIGRTIQDILLDGREDHPIIQGHLTALDGHETSVRVEWGGRLYTARIAPLRSPDDRIVGCVGVHLEIGWLPDDEGTLRESDVRFHRVVDSSPMGIAFGNDGGDITDANDSFLQIVGCTREDLMDEGISWPALMPVETHQRQIQALKEIETTGRCAPFETEIIRKDGSRLPVLVTAVRLSARRREGVAFVRDLSERKRIVGRLKAELACADALAFAGSPAELGAMLRDVFVTGLSWQAVTIWKPVDGPNTGGPAAAQAVATGQEVWSAERRTLAIPLRVHDRCCGVLLLSGPPEAAPDDDLLQTCRRIADRIGRFLDKFGGLGPARAQDSAPEA
jgi:PAS domain S-box-containing protein